MPCELKFGLSDVYQKHELPDSTGRNVGEAKLENEGPTLRDSAHVFAHFQPPA